ncbi:hypothetical protein BSD967_11465 [Bifidobacterium saguini]|uniref:Uncharacterized protein n=1 Tax=Bifidobacterium saguini TaxID=762210 RepID=A0ABX7SEF5_9BIFI|nr:hypothetical protein [Bifidobacterium saguini]QTB90881.1 hypothetical protein BSD967_11465 [Bifidobacterium saguini]
MNRKDVVCWLETYMREAHGTAPFSEIAKAAAEHGISKDQLKRAKKELRLTSVNHEFQGAWYWQLPQETHEPARSQNTPERKKRFVMDPAFAPSPNCLTR